jgi:hypothetical protein
MKHDSEIRQVLDYGFQQLGPAQRVGGIEANAHARARDAADNACELRRAKRFVVLKGECNVLPLELWQNLPQFGLGLGHLVRPAQVAGQDRAESACANPVSDGRVPRQMFRIKAPRADFKSQASCSGDFPQAVKSRIWQFMKRKIVGKLHQGHIRFDSFIEQAEGIERPMRPRVFRHSYGPRHAPGCDSELHWKNSLLKDIIRNVNLLHPDFGQVYTQQFPESEVHETFTMRGGFWSEADTGVWLYFLV